MLKIKLLVINFCFVFLLISCSSMKETEVEEKKQEPALLTISAASSLMDVLGELSEKFTEKNPHVVLQFNFGASGALKQQIEQGAPVDVFISAAEDKYQELVDQGLVQEGVSTIRNELVLVTPMKSEQSIQDFKDLSQGHIEKLSIGTPEVVPAGTYGQQVLTYYGVWGELQDKVVYAKDVRQVLSYVETGNVEAGIVYKTDALTSDKVRVIATAPANSHDLISYPFGAVTASKYTEEVEEFLLFLESDEATELFLKYGFNVE